MLAYLSNFFLIVGSFFMISAIVGLMRYKDFYIKLHTLSMFNIYGVSSTLFSLAIKTYDPIIFFEVIFLIIINIISTVAVVSVLFRNAILSNVKYKAKTRDDITQEEMLKAKDKIGFIINDDTVVQAKKDLRNRLTEKDKIKLEKITKKEEEKKHSKEIKKEEKKTEEKIKKKTETKPITIKSEVQKQEVKVDKNPPKIKEPKKEMTDIEKENEELRNKIREQKKILRKKIETVRRNAFITRKPEEIQKAEDLIKGILDKYHLTEDMLKDDYED